MQVVALQVIKSIDFSPVVNLTLSGVFGTLSNMIPIQKLHRLKQLSLKQSDCLRILDSPNLECLLIDMDRHNTSRPKRVQLDLSCSTLLHLHSKASKTFT